jgi:hypothetical protein
MRAEFSVQGSSFPCAGGGINPPLQVADAASGQDKFGHHMTQGEARATRGIALDSIG